MFSAVTRNRAAGFSLVELLVVVGVLAILSAISLPYLINYKKLYRSEDQALKVMDLMRETSQLALTRRRTMRFELDLTANAALIIDENGTAPDKLIKKVPLENPAEVRFDVIPATVTKPNPPNYADIAFTSDTIGHMDGSTSVSGHSVWAGRFRSDGSMVNNANVPVNANIYFWPPESPGSTTARRKGEIRAITVFGGSSGIRYWKHNGTSFVPFQ